MVVFIGKGDILENPNVIFISHNSSDSAQALSLYNIILELHPELKGKVFLDCCEEQPLVSHSEWRARMMNEIENSQHLIFITSNLDYIKEGNGWLFEEVSHFKNLKTSRNNLGRSDLNLSYFGIFLCECDFENSLFNDAVRGSEYRMLYQSPEHFVLGSNAMLESAKALLKAKIDTLLLGGDAAGDTPLILDKARSFAKAKEQSDYTFSTNAIDDRLIPTVTLDEQELDFEKVCELVKTNHISLVGSEGGCGKTTVLTKLFYTFLDAADSADCMIPLYIDAKSLLAENHLILRHLTKDLFDEHTAMTDRSTGKNTGLLDREFSKKTDTPQYLLIIDGYNEIPESSISQFNRELLDFMPSGRYSNVRLIISGRQIDASLPECVFEQLEINPLSPVAISAYIKENGLWKGRIEKSLFNIMSIPMYLKMYVETAADDSIKSKSDLLCSFVNRQHNKDDSSAESERTKALYQLFLGHVLPLIAHRMITKGASTYLLSENELEHTLADALNLLTDTAYKRFYGAAYREQLRTSDFASFDELDLSDMSIAYFVRVCKMLRQDNEGNLDFVHQIYRDFFCAKFTSEQMKLSLEKNALCDAVSQTVFDSDITGFITELLHEDRPIFDTTSERWDYSCNDRSVMVPLLDMLRDREDCAIGVANVIEILKYARKDDLSGLDLSRLDLTKTALSTCHFYRYDKTSTYPTSFANSVINRENIFTENHFDVLLAACTNEECVASIDSTGVIKFWERKCKTNFPTKIISGVRYSVRKMLFGPENDRLYAMTDHEILEISIPSGFSGTAQPVCVFKTTKRLCNIMLDKDGRLAFTTILNPFNFKYIDNPDAPDEHRFYGINSAASMLAGGKRLAFGHIMGYDGLKIYDYCEDEDSWKERKFGYSAVLDAFMTELEDLFRREKIYYLFPTDNEFYDKKRRTFFSYIQQQFEDCTHDHDRIPALIAKRCRDRLEVRNENPITLRPHQVAKLNAIVEKYEHILKDMLKNNNLLMLLSGRKVTGISQKKDSNTILISLSIDYTEKLKGQRKDKKLYRNKRFDSLVIELDTDTFETRFVTRYFGNDELKACYSGDDILVLSNYRLTVFDNTGGDVARINCCSKPLRHMIVTENQKSFYLVSAHFIYEMDTAMRCIRSINNIFGSVNLCCVIDGQGSAYLSTRENFSNVTEERNARVINLQNGLPCSLTVSENSQYKRFSVNDGAVIDDMSFKVCSERLVAFKNKIKCDETDVPYKLFVCGCDFRNISGNITEPHYIRMLNRMGAVTDDVSFPAVTVQKSEEIFTPSEREFILPENVHKWNVPYSLCPDMRLEEDCHFSDMAGGNHLYIQKTWDLINKGSYSTNDLEEADYSILEWTSNLDFAISSMIDDLTAAGIIAAPTRFSDTSKRLSGPLHRTFKFLFRSRFCEGESPKTVPVYTVCFPYGATLLQYITGKRPKNLLMLPRDQKAPAKSRIPGRKNEFISINGFSRLCTIRQTLALNQWFSITARRHKDILSDYSLRTIFDTDSHFIGRGKIHGYLELSDRPFFAEAFRSTEDAPLDEDIVGKVSRLCILSLYYTSLTRYGKQLNLLKKQPVIVLIGESLEHCKELNSKVESLYPNVRKLFTFDALLTSQEAFEKAGNYFEFSHGVPHSVKIEEVI